MADSGQYLVWLSPDQAQFKIEHWSGESVCIFYCTRGVINKHYSCNWIVLQPIRSTIRVTQSDAKTPDRFSLYWFVALISGLQKQQWQRAIFAGCAKKKNTKVSGIYTQSSDLFAKLKKSFSIVERFKGIGLTAVRETSSC